MANLRELSQKKESLIGGHRLCPGCGASVTVRQVLLASEKPVVVVCATGCLEVGTTIFPYTAWQVPFVHIAFENASSVISGIETAYRILKKKGVIKNSTDINFIAFGGDGGTYDIGLQALSGALERGHNFVYVCYDNEAYMNTGIQRSSATPFAAATSTEPPGLFSYGKTKKRKNLTEIVGAHNIPYVAQSSIHNFNDLMKKADKAFKTEGPAFINVLSSCNRGWRGAPEESIELCRLAVETCFWPLYEIQNGVYTVNYKPQTQKPITDWLTKQGRFDHLFKGEKYQKIIEEIQTEVNNEWSRLLKKCEYTG
jgi:pyruvate ferredoxin oxidoreductase beta subunit